jgi:hypothetical protein
MKRIISTVFSTTLVLAAAGIAGAQPGTGTASEVPPPPPDEVPADPTPVADPPPTSIMRVPDPEPAPQRPTSLAVGIGLGYDLPADLQAPNTTSVRFRFSSGMTFEPSLTFGRSTTSTEIGMSTTETKNLEVTVSTLVRYPLHQHGRVDFEILGGAGLSIVSDFPDGSDNDIRTTSIGVSWGLGLGYWLSRHWQLSLSALNPLFVLTRRTTQTGPDTENTTSSTTMAAQFDPNVIGMVHLYW